MNTEDFNIKRESYVQDSHLKFLDALRDTGVTNMYGAAPYIQHKFQGVSLAQSYKILAYWMQISLYRDVIKPEERGKITVERYGEDYEVGGSFAHEDSPADELHAQIRSVIQDLFQDIILAYPEQDIVDIFKDAKENLREPQDS